MVLKEDVRELRRKDSTIESKLLVTRGEMGGGIAEIGDGG